MKSLQALQQQLQTHPEASVRNLQRVLDGKSNTVLQQLQQLGQDGASMNPGQLQGLAALLSKQGMCCTSLLLHCCQCCFCCRLDAQVLRLLLTL